MSENACPVDHETRQAWLDQQKRGEGSSTSAFQAASSSASSSPFAALRAQGTTNNDAARAEAFFALRTGSSRQGSSFQSFGSSSTSDNGLSSERVISSIPRSRTTPSARPDSSAASASTSSSVAAIPAAKPDDPDERWVYPSPAQFYNALARKNHSPQVADMSIVVPIHNAVNERAWEQILAWEKQFHPESQQKCGGVKLISFQGKPKELSWKAWFKTSLLGYSEPFDRHDWLVDRCGEEVRYIIDFYTGRQQNAPAGGADGKGLVQATASAAQGAGAKGPSLSFYLDVRPAPDSFDNLRMRASRLFAGESR